MLLETTVMRRTKYIPTPLFVFAWLLLAVSSAFPPVLPTVQYGPATPSDPQALLAEANRLSWLGNWRASAPYYEQAELLFKMVGDQRNALYASIGRHRAEELSLDTLSRFLQQQLQLPLLRTDPELRLWALSLKGYTDLELNIEAAKRSWTEALTLATTIGEGNWASRARGELGVIAFLEGNPTKAVSLVGQALLSLDAAGDKAGEARLLEMLGYGYNEVHRFAEAHFFFGRAISVLQQTPDSGFPYNAEVGDAQAFGGEGHRERAGAILKTVLSRAREENNYAHQADALLVLGEIALQAADPELAKTYLREAVAASDRVHAYRSLASAWIDLAGIYRREGDLSKAESALTAGVAATQHLRERYSRPRNLTAAAELKIAQGQLKEADLLFEEAEIVIDGMLLNQHTQIGQASLAGSMSHTYVEHFHLIQQQGNTSRALQLIERVRGRTLLSRNYEEAGDTRISAKGSPKQRALEAEISNLQVALLAANDPTLRLALETKLMQNERHLAFEDNQVSQKHWLTAAPATLRAVQKILRKNELLLEYVLDEPQSFCIAVTAHEGRILRLSVGGNKIQELVDAFLSDLKTKRSNEKLAQNLYDILIKQAAESFPRARWIIAGDGVLNFMPFEALQDAGGNFMVRLHILSYTPSATALYQLRRNRAAPAGRPLLAIGDVDYASRHIPEEKSKKDAWIPASVLRDLVDLSGAQLQNLPESRQEVLSIARMAGPQSKILLGKDATESAVKAERLADYRVLHMAVHAISDAQYPDRSALVLAADSHPDEDGLLQVREISRLRLQADLVTLSACQTRLGTTEGEAGVISLEQAFLVGGAKAVVATLWNVEDESATQLMEAFYRRLIAGEDKAAALTHAKREFVDRALSPYYWAGFVIAGEASSRVLLGARDRQAVSGRDLSVETSATKN